MFKVKFENLVLHRYNFIVLTTNVFFNQKISISGNGFKIYKPNGEVKASDFKMRWTIRLHSAADFLIQTECRVFAGLP